MMCFRDSGNFQGPRAASATGWCQADAARSSSAASLRFLTALASVHALLVQPQDGDLHLTHVGPTSPEESTWPTLRQISQRFLELRPFCLSRCFWRTYH